MGEGAKRTRIDSVDDGGDGEDEAETLKLLNILRRKSSIEGATSGTTRILIAKPGAPTRQPISERGNGNGMALSFASSEWKR